jgi:hypothetical protein
MLHTHMHPGHPPLSELSQQQGRETMPFPANWLEELVIEWLDLEGFVISTSISVPAGPGGKFAPDVVGAKVDTNGRRLLIRHCEAAMQLIDNPKKVAERYSKKFSPEIKLAVQAHFAKIFGARVSEQAVYEKWVISSQPGAPVQAALREKIQGIQIHFLRNFVLEEVLPTIKRWKEPSYKQLPRDKWLLHMIDRFEHLGFISA